MFNKKLKIKLSELEEKLNFIADKLGYDDGTEKEKKEVDYPFLYGYPIFFGEIKKLTKWDALLKALNVEWKDKSRNEAHFKIKKPSCKKSTKKTTKKK